MVLHQLVTLVNDLICVESTTSCRAREVLMYYVVALLQQHVSTLYGHHQID
jgi:hypothetical protein